jgi:hypothetical protein
MARSEVWMGLPASQARILEKIESALQGSDPRLVSLFAIFTRLTCNEEMPTVEQLRARAALLLIGLRRGPTAAWRWLTATRRRLTGAGRRIGRAPRARLRTAIFFPLALALVASSFIVSSRFSTTQRCATSAAAARTARPGSRTSRRCKPLVTNPVLVAR